MKHTLLFLFLILCSSTVLSQLQLELDVVVVDYNSNKKESGAIMRVYDGSTVVGSATSSSNGKINLKVPAGKVYKVEISKAGKVTRYLMVNSKNIDIELLQGASEPIVRTSISLFDKTPKVDYSFIETNPITEFYFDGKSTSLAYNSSTADKMTKKVEEVIAQAEKTDGNNEVQYQAKMKEGEAFATAKNYVEAMTKFEQAQFFKPGDKISIKRMDDMDKLIKANKISQIDGDVAGGEYDNLVQAAKTLKSQKKYQLAIDKYEEALKVKPSDQFALDEIDELFDLIQKEKKEKANEAAYTAAMSTAEILMKQKSYQATRDQYTIALKAKPNDPTATAKMKEVMDLLDAAKGAIEKKKKFDDAIIAGDLLFKTEKWEEAKVKYDEALTYEAASTYAKAQNEIIKTKLTELEKAKGLKIQIDQLIADGNTAFTAEKWEDAKVKFTEVKKLDDKNAIAIERLAQIQLKLDELKQNAELEAKFKKLVDEGDLSVKGLKYEDAIAKYTEALALKSNTEVEKKKADAQSALDKLKNQKELKVQFDLAMKDGEALLVANKLEEAKIKFQEANTIDETAQLPKDKIKLIDEKILANKSAKEKDEQFNAAMEAGNTLRAAGNLEEAIAEYKKAQELDKVKPEPAKKIKEVQDEITALAASKSAKEKEEQFNALMEAGNTLRTAGKFEEAIVEYKKAQVIDKDKPEPAKKIKEVQDEIVALAANKSAKEKEEQFNAAMEAGNTLRTAGKFEEAIAEYKKAQIIDKDKPEPATKIKEVQDEMTTLASNKSAKEKEEKFNAAMEAGNTLRTAGKFEEAIAEYKKAQVIDNSKPEPALKIKEVQDEMTTLASNKSAKEKEEKFNAAMEAGNSLRTAGKLEEAIAEYKKAQVIDNSKPEPATKIKEVQDEITALNANKSAKEKEEKFNAAMEAGNALRTAGKLEEAIAEYKKAQVIDNSKPEPTTKIKEVQDEITALNANKSAKEKENQFNAAMEAANKLRSDGKLEEAITAFQKAQNIDNSKPEPSLKIKEIQDEISAMASNKSAQEKADKYRAAMDNGNTLRASSKFEEAIAAYQKAQSIDDSQSEPGVKIKEVQDEMAALNSNKSVQEKEEKFNTAMNVANTLRTEGKLEEAIAAYKKAQEIDNTKPSPALKIREVQDEITALAETKAIKEKEEKYNAAMTSGNNLRLEGKFDEAIAAYKKAQSIDDSKSEPEAKIKEIEEERSKKSVNTDDLAYTELMTTAAGLETSKDYKGAIEKYKAASNLKPSEKNPQDRIKALELIINDQEAQAILDLKYNEAMKKGNDAMAEEDYLAAIKHFNAANKIKPNEIEPVDKARKAEEMSKNKTSEEDALFEKMLLFAKQKMDEKDFVKAEELIKRAADNRPSDPRPVSLQKELDKQIKNNKDYQAKMTNAQDAFDKKEFDLALQLYKDAKIIMPLETKPDEGIEAVERELALLKKGDQQDEIYLTAIKNAETAVANKEYEVAITEYLKASKSKPADKTIEVKILAIKKIMNELAALANKQASKANFDALVVAADNLFESSKWVDAKKKYEEANALLADDAHVLSQIQKCSSNLAEKQNELVKYQKLIADADQKFNSAEYQKAKELYQAALKINNSDSYPHSQLAKIDGVLNPVFATDGALPNLGTPTDNSLLEGQALLERAARIRAYRSTTELREKNKEMDELGFENTKSKTEENQTISVELKNKIDLQELVTIEKDEIRKTIVDSVRFATGEIERLYVENNNYDNAEGLESRRLVTQKSLDMDEINRVKHEVYAENTEKVKKSVIIEQDNLIEKSNKLYNQQLANKTEVSRIEIAVEENTMDDLEDRKLVVDSVRNAQKALNLSDFDQSQKMIVKSMDIKNEVVKSNVIRENKDIESDEERQLIVEEVKTKQTQASNLDIENYEELYSKSLKNRGEVTTSNNLIEEENVEYKENQDLKIATLVSTEKKVVLITSQNQDNDDELRKRSKELIVNHVNQVDDLTYEGSKTPEKNQVVMKETINLTNDRYEKAEENQVQKNLDARKFVEDVANRKMVYTEKVANEIGANYPEGVSQETFQKNGNDGLPIAFITRRIVVINGNGQVYVRTQSLSAITYSKNGDPSSEYIWQKETSSSKLKRNF